MKYFLPLLLIAIFSACDSPESPEYRIDLQTDKTVYSSSDTVLISIKNSDRDPVFITTNNDSSIAYWTLQGKGTNNWTRVSQAEFDSPLVYTRIPADSSYHYRLILNASVVSKINSNIFRIGHIIYELPNGTKQVGLQESFTAPFFIEP